MTEQFRCLRVVDGEVCRGAEFSRVTHLPLVPVTGMALDDLYRCVTCGTTWRAIWPRTAGPGGLVPRPFWNRYDAE